MPWLPSGPLQPGGDDESGEESEEDALASAWNNVLEEDNLEIENKGGREEAASGRELNQDEIDSLLGVTGGNVHS